MAKRTTKKVNNNELDGQEFFAAIAQIEQEKGIKPGYMMEKITQALVSAYRRDHEGVGDNLIVDANPETNTVRMFLKKDVVEVVDNPNTEISLAEAKAALPRAELGDVVRIEVKPKSFGRIAAQTARQVIIQGIREAERERIMQEYQSHCNDIITATVLRTDAKTGNVTLELVNKTEAVLPKSEQVPGETFADGQRIRVYVMDVFAGDKGPRMKISRTRAGLVERLFEMEVPEIYDGTIEIKSTAREAGSRTKMAVWSKNPDVDAVGACIGTRGSRVSEIVDELGGEKIDIVRWSEDPAAFISEALSPAKVVDVELLEGENRAARVTVPDHQLSLAIGNRGQNARLTARLTGYSIDIRPESGYYGEEPPVKKTQE